MDIGHDDDCKRIMIIIADAQEMREEAFRRVGSDSATIEGQITAAER